MKNTKGMTLMESIIAIMVLSIASLMLFSGFSAVMRTMTRASEVKNNSDKLLSYAEKSSDAALRKQVEIEESPFNYTIQSDTSAEIEVKGTLQTLTIKNTDSILLRMIKTNLDEKVSDSDAYLNIEAYAKTINKSMDSLLSEWEKDTNNNNIMLNQYGYNSILKTAYLEQPYLEFDKEMLPESMKIEATASNPFYIKTYFPWEYYNSNSGFEVTHGGKLIFVSQGSDAITSKTANETLRLVYDYNANKWYSYCPTGADSYKKDYYVLDFSKTTNPGRYESSLAIGLGSASSNSKIMSWDEMLNHIKNPVNGWKVLDVNSGVNSGGIWRDIQ